MRNRNEIEIDIKDSISGDCREEGSSNWVAKEILEVLLDIRDLLTLHPTTNE